MHQYQADDAVFVSHIIPPMVPVEKVNVQITMENSGTTVWTQAKGYALGSQDPPGNTYWGTHSVAMSENDSILPGDEKTFSFEITAPDTDDAYTFR